MPSGHRAFFSLLLVVFLLTVFTQAESDRSTKGLVQTATVFPPVAELAASDGLPGNALGVAVAMSGDTVVVGEDCGRTTGSLCNYANEGVVYVFQRSGSNWSTMTQTARLTASDGFVGSEFGTSVAINGDTIVVGANDNKAYVFVKPAGGWTDMVETAQLSDGASNEFFGSSVGVDNGTVVVGAPGAVINGNQSQGAAYVYVQPASGWADTSSFNAQLTASDGTFQNLFGLSVAVSGNTIIAGSPSHQGQTGPGEAYIFTRPAVGWQNSTETAILTRSNPGSFDEFGFSVSIDRNTVVVGSPQAVVNGGQGAVDVFVKPIGGWVNLAENAELVSPTFISDLGFCVAIAGRRVAIGSFSNSNIALVFAEPKSGWASTSQPQLILNGAGHGLTWFGFSVAMANDAVVVTAPLQSVNHHVQQGAALVFSDQDQ
ncbi:MAG TPA: FG-GAP repeat protein [Candidatus Solibacter sp.]|nr:FG-GAP repeat protein [Candidatus Solibacter sp.]